MNKYNLREYNYVDFFEYFLKVKKTFKKDFESVGNGHISLYLGQLCYVLLLVDSQIVDSKTKNLSYFLYFLRDDYSFKKNEKYKVIRKIQAEKNNKSPLSVLYEGESLSKIFSVKYEEKDTFVLSVWQEKGDIQLELFN